jgi:hypothetical protein
MLYAWNPLVLIEVAAGHNDVLMLTGLLLGLYLLATRRMLWAMAVLGAAVLIKISALPLALLIVLGVWLRAAARRDVGNVAGSTAWVRQLQPVGVFTGVIAFGYLPFYLGHSLGEIANSFAIQPTSQSLVRAVKSSFHTLAGTLTSVPGLPRSLAGIVAQGALLLNNSTLWSLVLLTLVLVTTFFVLPLLRTPAQVPTAVAWVYASWMVFLSVFHLLRTWYLIPLVGLVCLVPVGRPLRRFVLTLTATVQMETLFLSQSPPFGGWQDWTVFLVVGIPTAILLWEARRTHFSWHVATQRSLVILRALGASLRPPRGAASAPSSAARSLGR